ncbi:hypothetical protein C8R47DRAFT_928787, partial [Mycena vitilis]
FFALATADGPGMATLNGLVGHHGKHGCRMYCSLPGRHKEGASHYYPARFKPDLYFVEGCDHDDVDLGELLDSFGSEEAAERYHTNLKFVSESKNQTQYKERRLETGICKPTIFSGLPRNHRLGVPDCFAMDAMHAPCINLPDLMIPLWRGTFDCDKTDDRAT